MNNSENSALSSKFQTGLFDGRLIQGVEEVPLVNGFHAAPLVLPNLSTPEAPFFVCPHCDFRTVSGDEASDHVVQCHTFACRNCPAKFLNQDELDFHIGQSCFVKSLANKPSGDLTCQSCGISLTTKKDHEWHFKNKHILKGRSKIVAEVISIQKSSFNKSIKTSEPSLRAITPTEKCRDISCKDGPSEPTEHDKEVEMKGKRILELYNCNLCDFKSTNENTATIHVEETHCFKCSHCGKLFLSKDSLGAHSTSCSKATVSKHKNPTFSCRHCEFHTISRQEMNSHIYRLHNFKCSMCKQNFLTVQELTTHKQRSHGTSSIRNLTNHVVCPYCDFKAERQIVLDSHIQRLHKFPCRACRKYLTSVHDLNLHKKTCSNRYVSKKIENLENKYNCPLCVYSTNRRGNILRHFRVHPDAADLLKTLDQTTHIENQMEVLDNSVLEILVTDLTTKPNESFNGINNLTSNSSGDTLEGVQTSKTEPPDRMSLSENSPGTDPESTDKMCSEDDFSNREMKAKSPKQDTNVPHLLKKETEKCLEQPISKLYQLCDQLFPLVCKTCDEAFNQYRTLVKHFKNVHKSTPIVECEFCGKSFSSRSEAVQHICSLHLMTKPFECQFCTFKFSYIKNLRAHYEKRHLKRSITNLKKRLQVRMSTLRFKG